MDKDKFNELVKAHPDAWEPEWRWCFAVDLQRVKGEVLAQYKFPDAIILHLSCPRYGGEFIYYADGWKVNYLKSLAFKLHPELNGQIGQKSFNKINSRVFVEYLDT